MCVAGAIIASIAALNFSTKAMAQGDPPAEPKFLNLRFDEDFTDFESSEDRTAFLKNITMNWRVDIGGEFRVRVEARSNARFGAMARTQNTQQFYRWMLHTNLRYKDTLRFFLQGIVAHAEDQDTGFNGLHENHGDLHQAFFDWHFLGGDSPWYLRTGRQELLYGGQRFVSPLEWASTRRRFDAVKLVYEGDPWHIEGFYAKPVVVSRHNGDNYNEDFDFAGIYATYSGIPDHGLDVYAFAIDRTQDTANPNGRAGDQSIYTLGSRFWGKTSGFDYEAEFDGQWGKWSGDTVVAWSVALDGGYTFDHACKPRIGVGFDWASGDEDPFDGKVETFSQMFPLGHKYFGFMDLIGRQNATDLNFNVSAWAIPKKVKTRLAYHTFWLSDESDALYNAGGAAGLRDITGNSGKEIGSELDLTCLWKINNHSSMLFGYSHFWEDGFVHDTVFRDDDPDLFYVQYQYKF